MAATTLNFYFEYENDVSFKLSKKHDSGDWITVVEVEENAHISDLWPYLASLCKKDFEIETDAIGVVMKS